jgi:hypothetical protein
MCMSATRSHRKIHCTHSLSRTLSHALSLSVPLSHSHVHTLSLTLHSRCEIPARSILTFHVCTYTHKHTFLLSLTHLHIHTPAHTPAHFSSLSLTLTHFFLAHYTSPQHHPTHKISLKTLYFRDSDGWQHETQILTWVLSYDKIHSPESLSICSASAAMCISEVRE